MQIIHGDLWAVSGWKIIPTNLTIRKDGLAVMGRGVAAQAVQRYPQLPKIYGQWLQTFMYGEYIPYFEPAYELICLPVKTHWQQPASLQLIRDGVKSLAALTAEWDEGIPIALPLLGCGFGELKPREVFPILEKYLTADRFVLVLRDDEATKKYADTLRPGARRDRSMEKL